MRTPNQIVFINVYFLNAIKVRYSLHIFHNLKKIFINFFLIFTPGGGGGKQPRISKFSHINIHINSWDLFDHFWI